MTWTSVLVMVMIGALFTGCATPPVPPVPPKPALSCGLTDGLHTVEVGGEERSYHVAIGSRVGPGPAPLVFIWHGFGAYGPSVIDLVEDADWPEAIRVLPKGQPRSLKGFDTQLGWQIEGGKYEDKDLAFFDALLGTLTEKGCVDPGQVFSTGFSNGGFFSSLLGCHRSDRLTAIAPVAGGGPFEACTGTVPVLIVNGAADSLVDGRLSTQSFQTWQRQNGCAETARPETGCIAASACQAPVEICMHPGGHRWPKDTAARIVRFFKRARGTNSASH